jgi:hypothetical protein
MRQIGSFCGAPRMFRFKKSVDDDVDARGERRVVIQEFIRYIATSAIVVLWSTSRRCSR